MPIVHAPFISITSCLCVPSLSNAFIPMCLNNHPPAVLQVLPNLLSKHEAVDVFMECEEENDADEQTEAMLLPAFMETLAMVCCMHVVGNRDQMSCRAGCLCMQLGHPFGLCCTSFSIFICSIYIYGCAFEPTATFDIKRTRSEKPFGLLLFAFHHDESALC